MKKSLLLLSLLALPTFTLAEVQLYGTVKSGIETSRTKIGDTRYSQTAVRDYDSQLGMRGSVPLGGSTAAVYQFDTSSSDTGSSMRDRLRRKKESGAMPVVGGR